MKTAIRKRRAHIFGRGLGEALPTGKAGAGGATSYFPVGRIRRRGYDRGIKELANPRRSMRTHKLPDAHPGPNTDTAPCVGCGLCCDGTIFWKAAAEPDERQRLTDAGLSVVEEGGKEWFTHPCRFSKRGLCTIYDQERFNVCRTFRCKLLQGYQAGEISREEALGTVQRALALRSALTEEEPGAGMAQDRRKLRLQFEATKERPALHLKMATLDYVLEKWFRA